MKPADQQLIRERLLSEAQSAIVELGFFGVSARQVALNVGVHPSTVGLLFGGRTQLLQAAEARLKQSSAQV